MSEDWDPEDWARVGRVLKMRRRQRRLNQEELAARSGVSLATVKEIETNSKTRRRGRRTLESLSEALGLPRRYLHDVLNEHSPEQPEADPSLQSRVETLEQRMSKFDVREQRMMDFMQKIDSKIDIIIEIQHSHPDQQADP